jgi:hypothetical protein
MSMKLQWDIEELIKHSPGSKKGGMSFPSTCQTFPKIQSPVSWKSISLGKLQAGL